jgi:hypothetical protein
MLIRTALATTLLMGTLGALSLPASAETPEERAACIDDAQTHCGQFIPDREGVYQCLVKKKKIISAACRKVIERPSNGKTHS